VYKQERRSHGAPKKKSRMRMPNREERERAKTKPVVEGLVEGIEGDGDWFPGEEGTWKNERGLAGRRW